MKPSHRVASHPHRNLSREIPRQELVKQLRDSPYPVVAFLAPSGYGKTTLLSQHLETGLLSYIWLTLNEDHTDYRQLASALLSELLLDQLASKAPQLAQLSEAELMQSTPTGAARLLASYLNSLDFNLNLILDRTEFLSGESSTFISKLIDQLGEGHRVFLAGYSAPGVPLSTWQTQNRLLELGIEDLAFSLEETSAFLQNRQFEGDAAKVYSAQEGWPAGIALVAAGARTHLKTQDLVTEVLDRLPPPLRQVFPEAAVVEEWSEPYLKDLGANLPVGWTKKAIAVGLPIAPLGAGQYRPHQILLDTLEAELCLNPERHSELHKAAAKEEQKRGHTFGALKHLIVAKAKEEALTLAEQAVTHYQQRWEHGLARQVLEQFDLAELPPSLQVLLARSMVESNAVMRAETLLYSLLETQEAAHAYIGLARIAGLRGDHAQQLELIHKSMGLSKQGSEWGHQLSTYAWALSELGRSDEAVRVLEELLAWGEHTHQPVDIARATTQLGATYASIAQVQAAEQASRRSLKLLQELGFEARALFAKSNLAVAVMVQGRMEEAKILLDQAIPLAAQEGHVSESRLRQNLGDWHLLRGEYLEALEAQTQALWTCGGKPLDGKAHEIRLQICTIARILGRDDLVRHHLGRAREAAKQSNSLTVDSFLYLEEGLELFYSGKYEAADQQLRLVQRNMEVIVLPRALAYRVEIARRLGRLDKPQVEAWMRCLDDLGGDQILRIDAPVLQDLYRTCVQQDWFAERFKPWLDVPPLGFAHTTEAKEIQANKGYCLELKLMGKPEVFYVGQAVHIGLSKSLELLALLTLKGPSSREGLVDALWDGSADPKHGEFFRVAVRKLRIALREAIGLELDPIPHHDGVYQLNAELEALVDTHSITGAIKGGQMATLYSGLNAYKGPFMQGFDSEWVLETRRTLQDEAIAVVLRLAQMLEGDDPTAAMEVYQRGLEVDSMSDEVLDVQERLCKRLNDVMGLQRVQKMRERIFR